jgi:hypothetical protein
MSQAFIVIQMLGQEFSNYLVLSSIGANEGILIAWLNRLGYIQDFRIDPHSVLVQFSQAWGCWTEQWWVDSGGGSMTFHSKKSRHMGVDLLAVMGNPSPLWWSLTESSAPWLCWVRELFGIVGTGVSLKGLRRVWLLP